MDYNAASFFVKRYLDDDPKPIMKLTKIEFRKEHNAFGYVKASPFLKKFNKFIQFIIESGIPRDRDLKLNVLIYKCVWVNTAENEDFLLEQLVIILLIGFSITTVFFICEFAKFYPKNWIFLIPKKPKKFLWSLLSYVESTFLSLININWLSHK